MSHLIPMPDLDLGPGVEITLVVWLKHAGDHVEAGEVIAEALTEKANVEIESPVTGVLAATLVEEGALVQVGQAIARVESNDD